MSSFNILKPLARKLLQGREFTLPILQGPGRGLWWRHSHQSVHTYWLGTYERAVQRALCALLGPGDTFWDLGAQCGFLSLLASRRVGAEGWVCSLDALDENCRMIEEQKRLNRFPNWKIQSGVLWSHHTTLMLETSGPFTARIQQKDVPMSDTGSRSVETLTLGDLSRQWPAPKVVKMDIEGAELELFSSLEERALPATTHFIMEIHGEAARAALEKYRVLTGRVWLDLDLNPLATAPVWGQCVMASALK